jgi:hypothetical protein
MTNSMVLKFLDRPERPGYVIFDPRGGQAVAWVPFAWLARRAPARFDYERPGAGW